MELTCQRPTTVSNIHYMCCLSSGWALAKFLKWCWSFVGGVIRWCDGCGCDWRLGRAACQLLPVPLERQQWPCTPHTRPVVQSERREWAALRLQTHLRTGNKARGGLCGSEVNHKEGEVIHPPLCQWAELCTKRERAVPCIQSVQCRKCSECSPMSHSEPGTASPHQRPGAFSVHLKCVEIFAL